MKNYRDIEVGQPVMWMGHLMQVEVVFRVVKFSDGLPYLLKKPRLTVTYKATTNGKDNKPFDIDANWEWSAIHMEPASDYLSDELRLQDGVV